jgi:hypothetical protein
MSDCKGIHKMLIDFGFKDFGYCACSARIRTYKKGRFAIKAYGSRCFLRLLEKSKLIKNGGTIEELIQKTVQELETSG